MPAMVDFSKAAGSFSLSKGCSLLKNIVVPNQNYAFAWSHCMTESVKESEDNNGFSVIKVFVSYRKGPVYEELPAIQKGECIYELLSSPGLALNLAKGDLIDISDPNSAAVVVKRGGNFCINLYAVNVGDDAVSRLESEVGLLLQGSLDGACRGNLVFSVPAKAGKEQIGEVFNRFKENTGVEWYYSNIYKNFNDMDDDTLLDWWLDY